MSDDKKDDVGAPVERLEPDSPLNQVLGAYQLMFGELYGKAEAFIDNKLHEALERKLRGWLDLKVTVDRDKMIIRRRTRAQDDRAPGDGWWTLPLVPAVLAELFERIKPEPEAQKPAPLDVDASKPAEVVKPSASEMLRNRANEARALAGNIKRTGDELMAQWQALETRKELARLELDLSGVAHALDREALGLERGGGVH